MEIQDTSVPSSTPAPAPVRVRCCSRCRAIYRSDFLRCPTDGAPIDERDGDPLIGTTLGEHYVIDACVGEGAMGRVYRAHHARLQRREFAVKVLLGDLSSTLAMRLRFAQEAEAASALDHPNVVTVTDVGRSESGLLFLVMDYVEGPLLSARIAHGPIPMAEAVGLARGLAAGLAHAHARGLVHRDFKPDNVILADGVPRIVDFGLAITVEPNMESARLTSLGATVGTPAYAAPEQASLGIADHRADLFALGVTLYEMLAGVLPFVGNLAELIHQNATARPPAIATRAPGLVVPAWLEAIVRRLMARDPAARFASAGDVIAALDRGPAGGEAVPVDAAPTVVTDATPGPDIDAALASVGQVEPRREPAAGRRRLTTARGLVAALAVAAVIVVAIGRRHRSSSPPADRPPAAPSVAIAAAVPPVADPIVPAAPVVAPPVEVAATAAVDNSRDPVAPPAPGEPVRPAPRAAVGDVGAHRTAGRVEVASPSPLPSPSASEVDAGVAVPSPSLSPSPSTPAVTTPKPTPTPVTTPTPTVTPTPTPVPRPAPPPLVTEARVAITGLGVRGSLSAGQVRRLTDRLAAPLASCYGPAVSRAGRSPTCAVQVHLTLDEDGRARDVGTDGGGLPGLATCVTGVVGGARSAVAPDVGTVAVTFTVTYQPEVP